MNVHVTKTVPIEFKWVVDAYQKVRQGGKATGIDEESWTDFDNKAEQHCYVIWNRMASGSYHAQPVRRVEISKRDGSKRKLGIPTLRDRIAQQVVKDYMEKRIDHKFHENSYGYRPMKSAHDALQQVKRNCLEKDWVIDMDIRKFFDEIDHALMLKAVEHILPDVPWIGMYVKRWLEAPEQTDKGELIPKLGKGTPQGGVISPILANIYLHYTLDLWLNRNYPSVSFVRYADDMVIHCPTKEEAEEVLTAIKARLAEVRLSIKEEKTRIAYCKDYRRKKEHGTVRFEFLGFSFQPLQMRKTREADQYFTGFGGKISASSEQRITAELRNEESLKRTQLDISDIAGKLNPKLRGWINYYRLFSVHQLSRIIMSVDSRLLKWIMKKHKCGLRKSIRKLMEIKELNPKLFYHWQIGLSYLR